MSRDVRASQVCGFFALLDPAGKATVAKYVLGEVLETVWGRLTVERMTAETLYALRDEVRELRGDVEMLRVDREVDQGRG